jgi:hypothetical protein
MLSGMNRAWRHAIGCALTAALGACGGPPSVPSTPPAAGSYSSAHFVFQYTARDAGNIATIASAAESQYSRIIEDLGAGAMPLVHVTLYTDHAVMVAATQAVAGFIPASASGLVTAEDQIHLMSPNDPAWGPFDRMVSNLVHEFAHCVTLHVNPRIANNPRWLWESVAIFESGQFVDLRTVAYMTAQAPPSLESLNSFDNNRVYDVGYSIAEFVVSRWDRRSLRDLIAANGDTAAVLHLSPGDFHRDWFAFVRERYGI